jgi:hypothetical protein
MTPAMPGPQSDPLAQLRGLHLPDAIAFWPPAPGWWLVAALAVAAAAGIVIALRRRRRSMGRLALRELDRLARSHAEQRDLQGLATSLSELLRRVAVERFDRAHVASLHGAAWERFLAANGPRSRRLRRSPRRFAGEAGRLIAMAPYLPPGAAAAAPGGSSVDHDSLVAATRSWIRWNT